ncbi:MAG TPA: hypothetical protein VKT22_09870 [Steroidobacteraceae bacterium]|nr:hypothetical protein [Steroidobacteraceae bacterium]
MHPRLILLLALVLPGAGHLVLGEVRRAFGFVVFMLLLGWLTSHLAPPGASFVGRHAGGFFVYALSLTDAYRRALWTALARSRLARAPSAPAVTPGPDPR